MTARGRKGIGVSRRGVLGGLAAISAAVLGACGRGGLEARLNDAVGGVDGVTSSALEEVSRDLGAGGVAGVIETDAAGAAAVVPVFDAAMEQLVRVLIDERAEPGRYLLDTVSARAMDGSIVLAHELAEGFSSTDELRAATFIEKYGLG